MVFQDQAHFGFFMGHTWFHPVSTHHFFKGQTYEFGLVSSSVSRLSFQA
jgi:hypothetical protein